MSSTERGKPLKRRQMEFGLVLGTLLLAAGLAPLAGGGGPRVWAVAAGTAVYIAALARPGLLSGPYSFMLKLGRILGRVNTFILLGIFFYTVLLPVGAVLRAIGKRPVPTGFRTGEPSYWVDRKGRPGHDRYRRMF